MNTRELMKPQSLARLPLRLWKMVLGWGCVGIVYSLAGLVQTQGAALPETALDHMIPFNPCAIWLYSSFFMLIPYTYFAVDAERLQWLTRSMQACALVCGFVFLLYPTTLQYPPVTGNGLHEQALRFLISADSSRNCLPSLHGSLTLLCVWALFDARYRLRSTLAALCGIAICYSVIQLRRHVSIDLTAGLLTGLMCGWICNPQPMQGKHAGVAQ